MKGPKDILILLLAATTLIVSLIFLPWSELGFNGNFPDWLSGAMKPLGLTAFFNYLGKFLIAMRESNLILYYKFDFILGKPISLTIPASGPANLGDYAYSLFLFLAMTTAAIAIILIGKEDNSEKTVLQAKK